jgi:hypothetical protein
MRLFILGFALIILYVFGIAGISFVGATLHEHTEKELWRYSKIGLMGILLFGIAAFIPYSQGNIAALLLLIPLIFCLFPFITLYFWATLMINYRQLMVLPDRVQRFLLVFSIGMGVIWSPLLGTEGIRELCNGIHQWQLAPVITGLQQYQRDSGRYPFGMQALVPYYLEDPPGLLCFGGDTTRYRLESCNDSTVVVLEEINPRAQSFHFLRDNGEGWEPSDEYGRECQ